MALQIQQQFPIFSDVDGTPLNNGYIYVGTANLNPETSPIACYWDRALTLPAAQPFRTNGGYIVRSGSPASVYTNSSDYSITVRNKSSSLIYSSLTASNFFSADLINANDGSGGTLWTTVQGFINKLLSSAGSSVIGFIQSGTGAIVETIQSYLRGIPIFRPESYGAIGNGVADDLTALNNCQNAALAAGGYVSLKLGKTYGVSNKFVPIVPIIGYGAGQYPGNAFITSANFTALPKSRILALAGFPALTPVVDVSTASNQLYVKSGMQLEGFMIDAAGIADYGLNVVSIKNSRFTDLLVYRAKIRGILEDNLPNTTTGTALGGTNNTVILATTASTRPDHYNGLPFSCIGGTNIGYTGTVTAYNGVTQTVTVSPNAAAPFDATSVYSITGSAASEGNGASQFNTFTNVTSFCSEAGSTATGWEQWGSTANNVNQNTYINCKITHRNGDGLIIGNADSCTWELNTISLGTGVGVRLKGNEKNGVEYARNVVFKFLQAATIAGTGGIVAETGTAKASQDNVVLLYSVANAAPEPVIQTGARFWYQVDNNVNYGWRVFTPTVTFTTPGDLSVSYAIQAGRYWKQGPTVHFEISLTFTPTHTTASGDFIIDGLPYASDTGSLGTPCSVQASSGMTWPASCTQLSAQVGNNSTQIKLSGMGSNIARANLTFANFPTGTAKSIVVSGVYESGS